jgi:hypothetical protein
MGILCAICTHIKASVRQVSVDKSHGMAAWWCCNYETIDESVDHIELCIKRVGVSQVRGIVNRIIIIVKICIKFNIRRVIGVVWQAIVLHIVGEGHRGFKIIPVFCVVIAASRCRVHQRLSTFCEKNISVKKITKNEEHHLKEQNKIFPTVYRLTEYIFFRT